MDQKIGSELFHSFDTDNTGQVDLNEMKAALKSKEVAIAKDASPSGGDGEGGGVKLPKRRKAKRLKGGPKVDSALARVFAASAPEELGERTTPLGSPRLGATPLWNRALPKQPK